MWIKSLSLKDVKGFKDSGTISFSEGINILIGANNAGKSTIINSIAYLQNGLETTKTKYENIPLEPYLGTNVGYIGFELGELSEYKSRIRDYVRKEDYKSLDAHLRVRILKGMGTDTYKMAVNNGRSEIPLAHFPNTEPYNILYPFLTKRKLSNLTQNVNQQNIKQVTGNFDFIVPKIDALFQRHNRHHKVYLDTCREVLGFEVTTDYEGGGKVAGLYIDDGKFIPITAMGEGVMHILSMIINLCVAEKQIFLIEELENDLHPKALKALLSLIEKKSENNQFIMSTHSNIITKFLGSVVGAKLFEIKMQFDNRMPVSTIQEIDDNKPARQKVLEDLGYEFFDFDLWHGWLFLEEASAETIIRDYLIPTFFPKLQNKLKTFSAGGASAVKPKLLDFNKLFVYLHLEPVYKDKVWVVIDGGEQEKKIIDELKRMYVTNNGWSESRFQQFDKHNFEEYYPQQFQADVKEIYGIQNIEIRRNKKGELAREVVIWAKENREIAQKEFQVSAKNVLDIIGKIAEFLYY